MLIRLLITLYAIYVYNRLYPSKMSFMNLILLCIFPVFFIAGTATININYLDPFYDKEIDDYDYENLFQDLIHLENINEKLFFIFIPTYLFIGYILYRPYIDIIIKERSIKKGIKSIIREIKK